MKKRYCNLTRDARHLAKEVERLNKKIRVSLSAYSSHLMENITKKISSEFQNELDQIFEEAKGNELFVITILVMQRYVMPNCSCHQKHIHVISFLVTHLENLEL